MTKPRKKRGTKGKPGPKPDTLKIEGSWKAAVKRALGRGKPPGAKPAAKARKKSDT
jgi:hypothetical protein